MADEKSTEPTKEDFQANTEDFNVNPVSSISDSQEIDSDILGGVNLWLQDPDNYGTKIGGIVAKEEMDRDKAQKILGEDVTIGAVSYTHLRAHERMLIGVVLILN